MRILHVIDSLALGGAERMLVDIANASVSDGHTVSVCVTRAYRLDLASELNREIPLLVLERTRRFDLGAMKQYRAHLLKNQIDVIHVHGRTSFSFCSAAKLILGVRTPIVLHDHNGNIEFDTHVPFWFRYWARYYVVQYIGVYRKLADWALKAGISPARVNVIGNGISVDRLVTQPHSDIRSEFRITVSDLIGIVVAGLRFAKGIDSLVEAVSRYPEMNVKIIICGRAGDSQYVAHCRALAAQNGIANKFLFVGERRDVPALLAGCDFALLPSRSESGPLVLIEYLTVGLPVVAFKVGDVSHVAASEGVPGIVEPNDIESFAETLQQLVSMTPEERETRGNIGRDVSLRVFSIQSKMPAFYDVYRHAIDAR